MTITNYAELLTAWCDGLLGLQAPESAWPSLSGGLWCPACSCIHGRCADAVYPLLAQARATGASRYLEAAVRVQAWSDHVTLPDGSWLNDPIGHDWRGITVFGAIALGEALRHHGMLLDAPVHARWLARFRRAVAFLEAFMTMDTGNINYPVSCAAAFALAAELLDDPRYATRARAFAHDSLAYFSPNLLLFGEGWPHAGTTVRGCRAVDLGYNVEESLPNLALYGHLTGDREVLETVAAALAAHLEFMLPDGGWDNSWGSRNYKWTYWGSRTSDGCQLACFLLADHDPCFAEAAARNARLLAACTHDGLLYGGPHYRLHGELPCSHHTFCHAKALAAALDYHADLSAAPVRLPRETARGIRAYPEIATWLSAIGPWRATVTANDWEYLPEGHASGGALSLLWHAATGPLITAGMTHYSSTVEVTNMQPHRDRLNLPLTPHVMVEIAGVTYRSCNDFNAQVVAREANDALIVQVEGALVDRVHQDPAARRLAIAMRYRFAVDAVTLLVQTSATGAYFLLPIVATAAEQVTRQAAGVVIIEKPAARVIISGSTAPEFITSADERIFNHVPGHEVVPLTFRLDPGVPLEIRLVVAE